VNLCNLANYRIFWHYFCAIQPEHNFFYTEGYEMES